MSSLLEQAIIDASALKEAAIKNAESAILNKYSTDIKEAVESLLEQDEDPLAGDIGAKEEMNSSSPLQDSIPLGGAPEEALDEQEIVLSMEELKDMAEVLANEDLMGDQSSEEQLASDVLGTSDTIPTLNRDQEVSSVPVDVTLEEEIDLDDLDEILEELIVDIVPQKSGWAATPDDIMDHKEQMALARRSGTEALAQVKALTQAGERLKEANRDLKAKNTKMLKALQILKESFNKVNLSNARLVYTNRVLTDNSLNGRQKKKIAEALSKSDSIEEAKVIFETLKSAVGSVTGKARPQSLREHIERPSATLPRRAVRTAESPELDRMQILAGIKTNNKGDF